MVAPIRLCQGSQELIILVQFLISVGISIQFKNCPGKETQEGIFIFLFVRRGRLVHRLGLSHLHPAPDQGIVNPDLQMLPVHTNINMVLFSAYGIKLWRRNLRNNPVPVRDSLKGKAAVLLGSNGKQGIFFGKFLHIRPKKPYKRPGKCGILPALRVLAVLHAVHASPKKVILYGFPLIDRNPHNRRVLACIYKDYRVFFIGKDICLIGGALFHIVAAKRQVGSKGSVIAARPIFGNGNHFQKPVCRNHAAIRRRQIRSRIEAKGNILVLPIFPKAEKPVCFQRLYKVHRRFLALVIKPLFRSGDFHGLPCVGKLHLLRFRSRHHACRSLLFLQAVTSKIEKAAYCGPVLPGSKCLCNRIFCRPKRSVPGINVLVGHQVIHRSRKPPHFIHRLVQPIILLDRSKHFPGLFDGKLCLLGHIVLFHRHDRLAAVNSERDGITGEHITVRRRHLVKLIIPHGQRFGQHKPAFIRHIEGVQRLRVRIEDLLGNKFPGG